MPTAPPSPAGSRLSHAIRFTRNPFDFLRAAHEECGDLFVLDLPIFGRYLYVMSAEHARWLYSQPSEVAAAGVLHHRWTGGLVGTTSTFVVDGEAHRHRQNLIIKHLNGPVLENSHSMMLRVVQRHIRQHLDGPILSCQQFAGQLSLEIAGHLLFGLDADMDRLRPLLEQFRDFTNRAMHSIWPQLPRFQKDWGPLSPWGRIVRMQAKTRAALQLEVEHLRRAGSEPTSISSHLIRAGLNDDEIVDELFTLLYAGHETTQSAMMWTIFQVLTHPAVHTRLVAEIDGRLGKRPIENQDLEHLPFLWAVLHEALRYSPISPLIGGRMAMTDFELGGYSVKAGDALVICGYTIWQRPDLWPNASEFDPERFLDRAAQASPDFFPFGRGRRICSGKGAALQEMAILIATLFQTAEIRLHHKSERTGSRGVLMGTSLGGLPFSLKSRPSAG